jgi:uncharacterized protein (TIGR02246 family)
MRGTSFLIIIAIVIVPTIHSCTGRASNIVEVENPASEISELWNQFIKSWEEEEAGACASIYHADGLNIPDEYRVNSGVAEIERFYSELFANNQAGTYRHRMESLHFNGDMAVEYATFYVDWISSEGMEWSYNSRALIHWKKDENGFWKIKTMLYNTPPEVDLLP